MTTPPRNLPTGLIFAATILLSVSAIWAGGERRTDEGAAFLGIHMEEEIDHVEGGVRVVDVVGDSPADEAGLEEGDIIQSFDGAIVRGPRALGRRMEERGPGDSVSLGILRDGRSMNLQVELGERSAAMHYGRALVRPFGDGEGSWKGQNPGLLSFTIGGRPKLGVQLAEATPELREHLGSDAASGVLVSKVLEGTPAEDGGILVGDLIVAVDGESVSSVRELIRELRDKDGETFDVDVVRGGRSQSITVTIPEPEQHHGLFGAPRA